MSGWSLLRWFEVSGVVGLGLAIGGAIGAGIVAFVAGLARHGAAK